MLLVAPREINGLTTLTAVTVELNVAAPALDISRVRATIPEPPSLPLNTMSLSCVGLTILNVPEALL